MDNAVTMKYIRPGLSQTNFFIDLTSCKRIFHITQLQDVGD